MGKRWILTIFILIVVSFLVWGQTKWGVAQDKIRFYSKKEGEKLSKVLENQELIMKELEEIKERLEEIEETQQKKR